MSPKRLAVKPGAERSRFRPDNILTYEPAGPTLLLDYLFAIMPDRKRTTVKDFLKHRQVMVNGAISTQFDQPLDKGDTVKVNTTREFQVLRHSRLSIVYEDDDIIVVNKGYGLLSMGNERVKEGTAYSIVRDYVKRKNPANKIFIVHRLDQHTSGLMMFAKNAEAKGKMQHNWNNMVIERRYVAVTEGKIETPEGDIRSYLAENSQHEVYSTDNPEEGKLATLPRAQIGQRLHPRRAAATDRTQKPDTRPSQRHRPPHRRRPQIRSENISGPPSRPPRAHSAFYPSRHRPRHEFLVTAAAVVRRDG